jgi:hypothetical protein
MAVLATGVAAAQKKTEALPAASGTEMGPMEQFVLKLRLDDEKQTPAAERVFEAAKSAATPYGQEQALQRRRLLDAELAGKADDVKIALDGYTESARKIAAVEAAFMSRVFADLKPDQKKKVTEAFVFLTGVFQPSAAAARSGRGRGGDR